MLCLDDNGVLGHETGIGRSTKLHGQTNDPMDGWLLRFLSHIYYGIADTVTGLCGSPLVRHLYTSHLVPEVRTLQSMRCISEEC